MRYWRTGFERPHNLICLTYPFKKALQFSVRGVVILMMWFGVGDNRRDVLYVGGITGTIKAG